MIAIDLTGKNALITGGTRGIGRAISLTLARAGACIGAIYRSDADMAARTLADLNQIAPGVEHFTLQADIADESQAAGAVNEAITRFGGQLDLLVLDAAVGAGGPLVHMKTEEWKRPFDVNVHGAFYVTRTAAPRFSTGSQSCFYLVRRGVTNQWRDCPRMARARPPYISWRASWRRNLARRASA